MTMINTKINNSDKIKVEESTDNPTKKIIILGIRGVPAAHGGFETFAEHLALWLTQQNWEVTVYCQGSDNVTCKDDYWNGVRRVHIPTRFSGALATIEFDVKSTFETLGNPGLILTLGYNTGFLSAILKFFRRTNIINMDGLEWKRTKYGPFARSYLWVNEKIAAWAGTRLIADHPEIANHLRKGSRKRLISVIPYGAAAVTSANEDFLGRLSLTRNGFLTVIARPEPENSILDIVRAFSRKPRGVKLVILGKYDVRVPYHKAVLENAGPEICFLGPVYDAERLAALRLYSLAYMHGHRVGGTNPSLVEALGAGNPIIAHDNIFNRWVAGDSALYFSSEDQCDQQITHILKDADLRREMSSAARLRWASTFTWDDILQKYTYLLNKLYENT